MAEVAFVEAWSQQQTFSPNHKAGPEYSDRQLGTQVERGYGVRREDR